MADGFENLDQVIRRVGKLATDVRHVERPLDQAAEYAVGSIKRTILVGGRPKKFAPHAPSTLRSRRKGKGRGGAKVLIDRGRLLGSFDKKVTTDGARIGTNVVYAARHHYGYPGGPGRGHAKTPARPFMLLQPEDIEKIGKLFGVHVAQK